MPILIKKLMIILTACCAAVFLYASWYVYSLLFSPVFSIDSKPEIISLDKSVSAYQFIHGLQDKHLISSAKLFLWFIRFQGIAPKLKAGVYQLHPGESAYDFIKRVAAGDVVIQKFAIIEGSNLKKVSFDLSKALYLHYNQDDWLSIQGNYPSPEGLLLADTYQYGGGSSSKSLLDQAHHHLLHYLNLAWQSRALDLPYKTPYELLIAASIIEKETAIPEERKLISGVLVNRLKKKMPLQMDPTVIYALGDSYTGTLVHNDLLINSPYNTYRYRGLPPTPIAMVSKEAIDAAAHPQESQYLYFVAKGDGSHTFSVHYNDQINAINQLKHKDN